MGSYTYTLHSGTFIGAVLSIVPSNVSLEAVGVRLAAAAAVEFHPVRGTGRRGQWLMMIIIGKRNKTNIREKNGYKLNCINKVGRDSTSVSFLPPFGHFL